MSLRIFVAASILISSLSAPMAFGGTQSAAISVVSGAVTSAQPQGRFEVFVANSGSNGGIFHNWELSDQPGWNSQWMTYKPIPDNNPHGLVTGRDGNGRIAVAWIAKGTIYFAEAFSSNASLSCSVGGATLCAGTASSLSIGPVNDPYDHKNHKFTYLTMAMNPNGLLEVLALTDRGRVYSIKETANTGGSSPWLGGPATVPHLVGGGDLKNISVAAFKNGLALAATGKDGKVYVKYQTVPGTWDADPWQNLDGDKVQEVHVGESSAHQLELVALGGNGDIYLNYQAVNSSSYGGWSVIYSFGTGPGLNGFGPTILFDHAHDGTLFLITHQNASDDSQWLGSFWKGFQAPNNGTWLQLVGYTTTITTSLGTDTDAGFGWLNRIAFAMSIDYYGAVHYFAVNHGIDNQVVEYVDPAIGASTSYRIEPPQGTPTLPALPFNP